MKGEIYRRKDDKVARMGIAVRLWEMVNEVAPADALVVHDSLDDASLAPNAPIQVAQDCAERAE